MTSEVDKNNSTAVCKATSSSATYNSATKHEDAPNILVYKKVPTNCLESLELI